MAFDPRLRAPKERTLFIIGAVFSGLVWLVLVVATIGLGLVGGAIALGLIAMAQAIFLANVKGNGVRVSPLQLPELYARCEEAARRLGLAKTPEIYLLQSDGILNAFATRLLSRHFVVIYSSLADSCKDPRQLDFIIGHEIGHLAAGHLTWNVFLLPFHFLPWVGAAYSRAREYTCDRCGFEVAGDLDAATRGLTVLAAGGLYAGKVNTVEFMRQREESGHFWMAVRELVSSHPYLCKRVAAVTEFARPGTVRPIARNVFAYPLAPILGFPAGGSSSAALLMVAYLGVVAAIAIPSFQKYVQKSRASQALQQQRTLEQPQPQFDNARATMQPPATGSMPQNAPAWSPVPKKHYKHRSAF